MMPLFYQTSFTLGQKSVQRFKECLLQRQQKQSPDKQKLFKLGPKSPLLDSVPLFFQFRMNSWGKSCINGCKIGYFSSSLKFCVWVIVHFIAHLTVPWGHDETLVSLDAKIGSIKIFKRRTKKSKSSGNFQEWCCHDLQKRFLTNESYVTSVWKIVTWV